MEEWLDIKGYEGYKVSNTGKVFSLKSKKELKKCKNISGYHIVGLTNKKTKTFLVHRLVAEAFLPRVKDLNVINHKDRNKINNSVDNLEWCNTRYNNLHYYKASEGLKYWKKYD
jgi:hypothetical protein